MRQFRIGILIVLTVGLIGWPGGANLGGGEFVDRSHDGSLEQLAPSDKARVPIATDDVLIGLSGTPYQVTLNVTSSINSS